LLVSILQANKSIDISNISPLLSTEHIQQQIDQLDNNNIEETNEVSNRISVEEIQQLE